MTVRSTRAQAVFVAQRLASAGHRALLAGGAVRDRLLGRAPGDHDLATSATPEEVEALFPRSLTVGARFGVVVVPVPEDLGGPDSGRPDTDGPVIGGPDAGGPSHIEVATFRADGLYVDGRRPEGVVFSDPPTDAARRDFTVNGLFEDPFTGEVLDYVGGRADLSARLVRAIGDPAARFREDHLRLLRAVRFAVTLRFALEPATFAAVRTLAPLCADVAAERVRDELVKILVAGRGRALRLLHATGLLEVVLPEIAAMRGVPQPPVYHPEGDVFVHTALVLDHVDVEGLTSEEAEDVVLAALLHDVAKPPTKTVDETGRIRFNGHDARGADMSRALAERLRFSRRRTDRVADLVATHMRFPALPAMRRHRLREFLGAPDLPLHLALHRADCGASHGDLSLAGFCETSLAAFRAEPVLPPPLLTGSDLLTVGYAPGPRLGALLRWTRTEQLDGRLTQPDDALRRVLDAFPPSSSEWPPS